MVGAAQLGLALLFLPLPGLVTVVDAVAELFNGVLSSGDATVAVFESVPLFFALTTMVTVAVPPFATVPRLHVTVLPDLSQLPPCSSRSRSRYPSWRAGCP